MANTFQVGCQSIVNVIRPTGPIQQVRHCQLAGMAFEVPRDHVVQPVSSQSCQRKLPKGKKTKGSY